MSGEREGFDRRSVLKLGTASLGIGAASVLTSSTASAQGSVTVDPSDPSNYDSIKTALEDVEPGGTVNVEPGTYNEYLFIKKAVTLRGDPGGDDIGPGPDAPELDGGGVHRNAFTITPGTSGVTIEGFEVHNYGDESERLTAQGVTGTRNTDNIRIRDNYIYDIGWSGITKSRNERKPSNDWKVERNHVRDYSTAGISIGNTSNLLIRNNRVEGSANHPIRNHNYTNAGVKAPVKRNSGDSEFIVENIVVKDNHIEGPFGGAGLVLNSWNANEADAPHICRNATIEDNLVKKTNVGAFSVGLNMLAYNGGDFENITVRGNDVSEGHGFGAAIQSRYGADGEFNDVVWENNNLSGDVVGLAIFDTDSGSITVRRNAIKESKYGIAVFDANGSTDVDAITVRSNSIADNEKAGIHNFLDEQLDAEKNWWGDTKGPKREAGKSGKTIGQGNEAVGKVDYTPWLTKEPDTGWT